MTVSGSDDPGIAATTLPDLSQSSTHIALTVDGLRAVDHLPILGRWPSLLIVTARASCNSTSSETTPPPSPDDSCARLQTGTRQSAACPLQRPTRTPTPVEPRRARPVDQGHLRRRLQASRSRVGVQDERLRALKGHGTARTPTFLATFSRLKAVEAAALLIGKRPGRVRPGVAHDHGAHPTMQRSCPSHARAPRSARSAACPDDAFRRLRGDAAGKGEGGSPRLDHLLPLARLCVWQSIVRLARSVAPPFDQAVTWSASISFCL